MIFENLADRLQETFKKLRGHGKLTADDVNATMREIRIALLEADVNFKVVKDFIKKIKERAVGQEVLESLTPAQAVIKIVNEELTALMGQTQSHINISPKAPTIIMMVGLQGAGKTTSAGKLGLMFKKQGKHPLMVAADIYRPAAIKQLQVLGSQIDIPVFAKEDCKDAVRIANEAIDYAKSHANDIVIIDTAGRLHIDENLMQELKSIKEDVKPHEILLVVDAMTGQDAVNVAESFNNDLGLDGVILTKMDGDARGGAALSVKAVTGCPIKFVGAGEKLEALEPFYPRFLATTKIDIEFTGVPSHAGSDPEKGRSALMAAAAAAVMMQGIPRHGEGDTRIAVGRLVAGEGRNVTPVHAFMQCETRGSTQEINEYMFESVRRIVEGCAASYGVECRVTKAGEATNFEATPAACDLAVEACVEVFGGDHVTSLETAGGSEDCSILARRAIEHGAEATFLFYGCNHHGHHRADFEIQDTQSLPAALAVLSGICRRTNGL